MTCIVGLVHDGAVYIGGDSCASNGYTQSTMASQKVWRSDQFVFGVCGSVRMGQLIRYRLEAPPRHLGQSVEEYLAGPWIDEVRQCFRTGGFLQVENESETGGTFMLGYRGRLFTVYDDFRVAETADGWNAIGSGEEVAKGVLHPTEGLDPETRILKALHASEYLNMGVRRPFSVVSLPA